MNSFLFNVGLILLCSIRLASIFDSLKLERVGEFSVECIFALASNLMVSFALCSEGIRICSN